MENLNEMDSARTDFHYWKAVSEQISMKKKQENTGWDYSEQFDYPHIGKIISFAFSKH
jgi:hypothetical protein